MFLFDRPNIEKLRLKGDFPGLVQALGYLRDSRVRSKAAKSLAQFGEPAIRPLAAALQDQDALVRLEAVRALATIGGPQVVLPLCSVLSDSAKDVRSAALQSLGENPGPGCIDPLVQALKDPDEDIRLQAAGLLVKAKAPGIAKLLKEALQSEPSAAARRAFVIALGGVKSARSAKPFIASLKDPDRNVRLAAVQMVEKFGAKPQVERLIELLRDPAGEVRAAACHALGTTGDERAVDPLIAYLHSGRAVQYFESALDALEAIPAAQAKILIVWGKEIKGEILDLPVINWIDGRWDVDVISTRWADEIRNENEAAFEWLTQQNFPAPPASSGLKEAADQHLIQANLSQAGGDLQAAWAGYHQALRLYLNLNEDRLVGSTCLKLGESYLAMDKHELAFLCFNQSNYLATQHGDQKGRAWSLFRLGQVCQRLGNLVLARQFLQKAAFLAGKVLPVEATKFEEALSQLDKG